MKIFIGGDFCPLKKAETQLIKRASIINEDLEHLWNDFDYRILNLEGPITNSNNPIEKVGRHIKFSPLIMPGLSKMGIDYFSLANNHIMDYGKKGIVDTIKLLEDNSIGHFGNYKQKYIVLEKEDTKVAILSFTNKEFSLLEDNDSIGAYGIDLIDILATMDEVKLITKNVILILHTGINEFPYPTPSQRKLCHYLIEKGALAILCQHSHISGAYEYYLDGFISYGQGSFVFGTDKVNSIWNKGYSVEIDISKELRKIEIIPHRQFDDIDKVRLLTEQEGKEFIKEINSYNETLNNPQKWIKEWDNYILKVKRYYFNQFFIPKSKVLRKILKKIDFERLLSKNKSLVLLNNIRNIEHREILIELLKKKIN